MSDLLLLCRIAGKTAAFPAHRVASVIEIEDVTPIPGAPASIRGLTALRSQALTVIDCAAALGAATDGDLRGMRAAVVEIESHPYALVVDEAHDVVEARSEPTPVPGGCGNAWQAITRGMVETDDGPTLLVEIEALVAGLAARAA